MIWIFLTGGLFLGWSLGANDSANVFGSAVGSRMISFKKAALICSIFVLIGAVFQGDGGSDTLNKLGSVTNIQFAFILSISAALTVFSMSAFGLPVSTSQAIVGAIIGWNIFSGIHTDTDVLRKIILTWFLCPVFSAIFASFFYYLTKIYLKKTNIHLLKLDAILRYGLIIIGAFGSFSLGANNIANVVGIFVPTVDFNDICFWGICFTKAHQLFFIGGVAIAIGVFSFSKRTMKTVGGKLYKLSPESALIIVFAHSLVLFIFSSSALSNFVVSIGLPPIPLVPVSSSQAIVGAIIGIGLMKGGYGINFKVLSEIGIGWISTPIISGTLAFLILFLSSCL